MTGTDNRMNRKLLLEYDQKKKLYDDFLVMILRFLGEFIKENSLGVFSFEGRVMTPETFQAHLDAGLQATCIEDVDNFVTVDILTFFEDDVHAVAHVLDTEFNMLEGAEVRGDFDDPKHFGYPSRYYLIKMVDSRLEWIEYRCFTDCKVRVQVSSFLQHTWARLQDRLGIDKNTIPHHQLRTTDRIVGLLELADRELNELKKTLPLAQTMQTSPTPQLARPLEGEPPPVEQPQQVQKANDPLAELKTAAEALAQVEANSISTRRKMTAEAEARPELVLTDETYSKLILDDPTVRRVDRLIADAFYTSLKFETGFNAKVVELSNDFHIPAGEMMLDHMDQHENLLCFHAEELIDKPVGDAPFNIPRGISILMMFHAAASEVEDKDAIDKIAAIVHHWINHPY